MPDAASWPAGLSRFQEEWLDELGFSAPEPGMPNWWIGVEQGLASEVQSASRAVVRALVEVYGVSLQSLTNALGTTSASGQTVKVEASQDLVIREVLRLVPELRTVRVGSDRVLAVPVNRKTSVELHRDGGVLSVKNLGPGDTA